MFAVHVQRSATGDEQFKLGAACKQLRHQRRFGNQVFEIVEHKKNWQP